MTVVHYEDTLAPGCHWSMVVRRGLSLTLTDEQGGANVGMLFYNPENPLERINIPDTLKCQHTFRLTRGHCIYSDMGRIFCSIVEDSLGWHDAVCGNSDRALVETRWGRNTFQRARNDMYRNGRDGFLIELAKYGLGKKDLAANLNLFSAVKPDADGNLRFVPGHSSAGDAVTLRFEMDTLVIFNSAPHPLDPSSHWPAKPVRWALHDSAPHAADDVCEHACGENQRGFANNAIYHAGMAGGAA